MRYTYVVQTVAPTGWAAVEYKTETLGSVTRQILLPFDRNEEQIRRRIVESFPLDLFYSKHLARNELHSLTQRALLTGEMEVDFDDGFYSIQEAQAQ